ncbi:hypothetical protein [Brumimicrobium oceani]|uniref:Uncharacterized protein n=1 Tax=Brumimicrobium oceani TaxID=2100725 RepID=A0A2U2XF89_9FLAO|nr:hypothetical protein [Brumimicrobium oceani]PWH86371.1 hypothetical protein DIT68_03780 [Brumimicrobium oceani]
MENGIILFATMLICLIIGTIGFAFLKRGHHNQKEEYIELWEEFQQIKDDESTIKIQEIITVGNTLVFNKYIPTKHLKIILELARKRESRNPEFEELKSNAYNKWINHTHGYPSGNGVL